jgi:hypothetical protein
MRERYNDLGYRVHKTRYAELGYSCIVRNLWRIIDQSTGRAVGPQYKSRGELLADLARYAAVFGCEGQS